MSFRGDTAVLVLAAGPGTRMRSETPKVLHTIAGRSMLSHSLHAITKVAPQRLVVVLGHEHQRIAPVVAELADTFGRTIDVALQDHPGGTGHAALCGLSALPQDYAGVVVITSGDTPLLDADTLADLIATHNAVSAAVICAPDGATSHHFAPKLSLPWPEVWSGPESPTKKYSG